MPASPSKHWLFLTGKLALEPLQRILGSIDDLPCRASVHELGVSVAALMTADLIARRLHESPLLNGVDQIVVPGRCRGDLDVLGKKLGIPGGRGPAELKDLPRYFGRAARPIDLSQHDMTIFAEIVDAPVLTVEQILQQASRLRDDGADVIDLGCLPQTNFAHLRDAVIALKERGFAVSVDSMDLGELKTGADAGADYLLSLTEDTLSLLADVAAQPVLIPATPGDLDSLRRAIDQVRAMGRTFLADPILDPIHFGFTASLVRYHQLRALEPDIEIMMGTGNVTELTHADTAGITLTLLGVMSELKLNALLTTQVSKHARKAVRQADMARRILYAARANAELPKNISDELMMLHERDPFPDDADDIQTLADQVRDPNYRIQIAQDGLYLYNRDGLHQANDTFDFWPELDGDVDASHAFYLGAELMRAQIAWQLGKRYSQDQPLNWGVAVEQARQDMLNQKPTGTTRRSKPRGGSKK